MRRSITSLLLAAVMLWPLALSSRAYTLQYTNGSASVQLRWPATTITVALSTSLDAPPSNIKAGSDVTGAARRALARWSEAANIRFIITTSNAQALSAASAPDGVNLITVSEQNATGF